MPWGNKFPDLKNDPSYLDPRLTAVEQKASSNAASLADLATQPTNAKGDGSTNDRDFIQQAINNTPVGGTLILPVKLNGYYLKNDTSNDTELLLITKPINIIGLGRYSQLVIDDNVPNTCDVIRVSPNMGYGSEMYSIEGITIMSKTNGNKTARHAINLDISQTGQYLSRMSIQKNMLYETNGYSINLNNPVNQDGFFCSQIEHNYIRSGIWLDRAGDSLNIYHNTVSGYNGIYVNLVDGANTTVIENNNVTSRSGIQIVKGYNAKVINNNVELTYSDYTYPNGAMIDIDGSNQSSPMLTIEVTGNNLTYNNGQATPVNGIRVNNAKGTKIENNMIAHNNGQMIILTSSAQNTDIGYNLYSCPQPDGKGFITDNGYNTVYRMVHTSNQSTGKDDVWQNSSINVNDKGTNKLNQFNAYNHEGSRTDSYTQHQYLYQQALLSTIKNAFIVGRRTTGGGIDSQAEVLYFDNQKTVFPQIGYGIYGSDSNIHRVFYNSAIPTSGTYALGDTMYINSPSPGKPSAYKCVAAGTPGTWWMCQQAGVFAGPTTSRFTGLTVNEVGLQYWDTTLGKPIWWNGSGWRDATGASV